LNGQTKGSLEAEVSNAIVRFQREQQGRGPADVHSHLFGETLYVRSSGIFTAIEAHLVATEEGRKLVKSARQELRSINRPDVESVVSGVLSCGVVRSYYDLDVDAGEQIEVYILDEDIDRRFSRDQEPGRLVRPAAPRRAAGDP
jgi:uncharacterized protein YbcI